jgi:hypothetical protein
LATINVAWPSTNCMDQNLIGRGYTNFTVGIYGVCSVQAVEAAADDLPGTLGVIKSHLEGLVSGPSCVTLAVIIHRSTTEARRLVGVLHVTWYGTFWNRASWASAQSASLRR